MANQCKAEENIVTNIIMVNSDNVTHKPIITGLLKGKQNVSFNN